MPAREPFTQICQQAARGPHAGRVDLHIHSMCSDGQYTPAEIVQLGLRAGLSALAITDHDTLQGVAAAKQSARGSSLEIVAGVEITAEHQGRELHLLAYFVQCDHGPLQSALASIRQSRVARFHEMVERLQACNVSLANKGPLAVPTVPGRRHLAEAIIRGGYARTLREAFQRYLGDHGRVVVPKKRLPVEEALALVHDAGGVAAWAHPPQQCERASLLELCACGLDALEAEYPDFRPSRTRELRELARALGLAVTGGSDCHGPGRRFVGAKTITASELQALHDRLATGNCRAGN